MYTQNHSYQPKYLRLLLEPLKEIGYYEFDDNKDVVSSQAIKLNSAIMLFLQIETNYFYFERQIQIAYVCVKVIQRLVNS